MATTAQTATEKRRSAKQPTKQAATGQVARHNGFNADNVVPSQAKPGEKPSQFAGLWLKTRPNE